MKASELIQLLIEMSVEKGDLEVQLLSDSHDLLEEVGAVCWDAESPDVQGPVIVIAAPGAAQAILETSEDDK